MRRSLSRWLGLAGAGATAVVFSLSPTGAATAASPSSGSVAPNPTSMVDCNGHSPLYKSASPGMGGRCTDPLSVYDGQATRFRDNGVYIGHDEPSVKFISNQPGSANDMTYFMQLARDPAAASTSDSSVTHYAQLSPAPWFGLPLCDPKSYPQNPCTPDSDTNGGQINNPKGAGSAFMELQFYAPGFQPFIDNVSCDATHYCAALTIDSLECTFGFVTCNNNCIEPVNFAFLQMNGVPAGPPSPQRTDVSTFTPNRHTLMMNPGDMLAVSIKDTKRGLLTQIDDLSTHRSGFMVASAANGFMNTNIADCSGTPFTFHAEYSSAQQQNQVPWAALEGGVLMQQEIGHSETCASVAGSFPVSATFADGQTFQDSSVFQTCQGGLEGSTPGEGPCSLTTGVCANATTETGAACPTDNFATGRLCEFSDAFCMPAGSRTINVNGTAENVSQPVAFCEDNVFQNGDLDFEGNSYQKDWPDGSPNHPTSFQYVGPFTRGSTYPTIQFETDLAASESLCHVRTGAGCTAPPVGAVFYPYWTIGSRAGSCVWNFGNTIPGTTIEGFGAAAEYGTPDVARFGGTLTSAEMANPQFSGRCL
jgi:hypothetical protein